MSIYYLDNDNEWASTDNSTLMKVEEMLQVMQTWKNEREFSVNSGVDYKSVLAKQAMLKPQLEAISENYASYFSTIIDTITYNGENIEVPLRIVLKSGVVTRTLTI